MTVLAREFLESPSAVADSFEFLDRGGFAKIDASPTLVVFRKGEVEIDIYHGRQSYEVGAGVAYSGMRYSLSEVLRTVLSQLGRSYRNRVARTPEQVATSVRELARIFEQCGTVVYEDSSLPVALESARKEWAETYALDVLEEQVRPKADDAFKRGDYALAAQLYEKIRDRLSPAESKKLALARTRSVR